MSIANTCVLIAAVMPVLTMGLAKGATAAHSNGFEALPLFAFAVLAAQFAGIDQVRTDQLAMAFIGARLVYTGLYFANIAALRSVVWVAGLGLSIAIFAPTLKLPI